MAANNMDSADNATGDRTGIRGGPKEMQAFPGNPGGGIPTTDWLMNAANWLGRAVGVYVNENE
jgi:hypothetical protein